ncbi:hypothetical protein JW916_07375 [Candidatus Sumerlaeota bacterium]|nr:hypothetical protein [Candidatus Sumerlaeota bacterium]
MAESVLPKDFREFLKFLNEAGVEYLLIGGYAVVYHGYVRTTADMDIWVAASRENASRIVGVFHRFGMRQDDLTPDLFLKRGNIVRMGVPPMRIEILNDIDGVGFGKCYKEREIAEIDGLPVSVISLRYLRANKRASGRHKDLDDLDHLPKRKTSKTDR